MMDKVEYSNKLTDLTGNGGYCRVKKGPTLKTEMKQSWILNKNKDLIPQMKYSRISRLHPLQYLLQKGVSGVWH